MERIFNRRESLIGKARELATRCHRDGFDGSWILDGMKVSRIVAMYGDGGSDWLWGMLRSMVDEDALFDDPLLEPAVFLLGVHYRMNPDRSESSMRKCNREFLRNCVRCVRSRHGLLSPRRYAGIWKSHRMLGSLERNCEHAWRNRGLVQQ